MVIVGSTRRPVGIVVDVDVADMVWSELWACCYVVTGCAACWILPTLECSCDLRTEWVRNHSIEHDSSAILVSV